jgi:PAS domain-containing protein
MMEPVSDPSREGTPLPDEGSFRQKVAGIADPITLLEGVLANSPVPCMVLTAQGHPLLTNPAFRQMFGREPPPEYNVHLDELIDRQPQVKPVRLSELQRMVRALDTSHNTPLPE